MFRHSRSTSLFAGALAFVSIASTSAIAYRHYRAVQSDFESAPAAYLSTHPDQAGIARLEAVTLRSRDGTLLAGWYVPSNDRAAVIVTHGTNSDRSSMLAETRILAEAGFGVLAFDWPGHGASGGKVAWSNSERQALEAAIDWVARRPDVDPARLGGLGFSIGGYMLSQVAAQDPRLQAVVLLAAPTDYAELTRWQNNKWGFLSELPALWALRNSGMPAAEQRPIDVVHDISPRPLLVIGSDADATVPPFMTKSLFDAARSPKSLWMIPGANHGGYARSAGAIYGAKLVEFFTNSLNPQPVSGSGSLSGGGFLSRSGTVKISDATRTIVRRQAETG